MTKDELSLLLYLETRAVDHGGKVDIAHMNLEDMDIVERWNCEGFIEWGRIYSKHVTITESKKITHWVVLSKKAWKQAHIERRNRADRMWRNRPWLKNKDTPLVVWRKSS